MNGELFTMRFDFEYHITVDIFDIKDMLLLIPTYHSHLLNELPDWPLFKKYLIHVGDFLV